MQLVIAAKQVMTNRNYVVQRAGCCKKNDNKRKREDYPAVVLFHPYIEASHN